MTKRRITKASKRRLSFFGPICFVAIIYFAFSLLYNTYTIYTLYNKKQELLNEYTALQNNAENLKIDIQKLKDSNYLANYAREHYLYSKDGEYILQLGEDTNETTKTINKISFEINKTYVMIALSLIMLFIFIYILKKGRVKKHK